MLESRTIRKTQHFQDTISNISLAWLTGDIQIIKSDTDEIKIIQYANQGFSENKLFDARVENGTLNILDGRKRKLSFGIHVHRTLLELHLPAQSFQSFSIQGTGSHITIQDIQVTDCNCHITSGVVNCSGTITDLKVRAIGSHILGEQLSVQKVRLQATSSKIDLSGMFSVVDTQITGRSMRIESSSMIRRLHSVSTGASVNVVIPENDGFTLQYKQGSGQMKSEFPLVTQGNTHRYKNGESKESTLKAEVRGGKFTLLKS
ncbi:hypothetical protein BVG16_09000 [Paenibacillus selenitireducens]|uniref:DUF4097 domain-containing protein n=1 Tax=Paenibacillus selenitireducens TaxID=1324314 RepID=A0A1T2XH50_9BACL|nr:DUF4097 family beta strand repeat-containing protein [Paenibacillus selenitireducens]OPA79219.1 hypothetical protein BVG16_09000 [Paenibacillus selenitireducens]